MNIYISVGIVCIWGLESSRKVFFFVLAILVAWKYGSTQTCGQVNPALNTRENMCENDATVQIQVLWYIPIHRVELSHTDELTPSTPNPLRRDILNMSKAYV